MTVNKSELVIIRDSNPNDRNFIFSTWLKGLRYGNDFFGDIDSAPYYKHYHHFINAVLSKPDTTVKVACLKEDPEVILGYSVYRGDTVHWVQVKSAWRLIGIAKSLMPTQVTTVTHLTKTGRSILKKNPAVKFNPFSV